MVLIKLKRKIDYEAIALFMMAKQYYKKADEYVKALAEHYNDKEEDIDIWYPVIEQLPYKDLKDSVKDFIKKSKQKKRA